MTKCIYCKRYFEKSYSDQEICSDECSREHTEFPWDNAGVDDAE